MSDLYLFLQRTQSWYGAVELVQSYRRNLRRGLSLALIFHCILLGLYWWFFYAKEEESGLREVKITTYEELAVSPGVTLAEQSLEITPILVREEESGDEPVRVARPSKGFT